MISALLGDLLPYLALAVAAVAAFFGYTHKTKKDAERATRNEIENDAFKEYVKDRKEIDNATPVDTNPSSARDRLRDRQSKRDRASDRNP